MPHYQKTVTDEMFERALTSLAMQEFKDFELLLYHDGPLDHPFTLKQEVLLSLLKAKITITEEHFGDWGHSLRDMGIKAAKGDYIIHMNADNKMYNVLKKMSDCMSDYNSEIYIFIIRLMNVKFDDIDMPYADIKGVPKREDIDAMQLVASKKVWDEVGGWYDKSKNSDGIIYEKMCKTRKYEHIPILIGEHY